MKRILLHYHFSDFEHKHGIEYESQHKRHENEKTTQSGFSLNITKWFVNNHQQKGQSIKTRLGTQLCTNPTHLNGLTQKDL